MKKVKEPIESETVYQCPRCRQDCCSNCQEAVNVDFEVEDKSDGFNTQIEQWKYKDVCPWCYNQLIDIVKKTK